jgi:hypothetical protein
MIMSTDIAMVHLRRARVEKEVWKNSLTIVCLWTVVGLVLAGLMFHFGFDAEVAAALATAG